MKITLFLLIRSIVENLINSSINNWKGLDIQFKKFSLNLFEEQNKLPNDLKKPNIMSLGNFNNKMFALHELCAFKQDELKKFCGFVLSFEKEAKLIPLAKLQFYSDSYGENLIHEVSAHNSDKTNLMEILFNHTQVWFCYSSGTSVFANAEWKLYMSKENFNLSCSLVFIPEIW